MPTGRPGAISTLSWALSVLLTMVALSASARPASPAAEAPGSRPQAEDDAADRAGEGAEPDPDYLDLILGELGHDPLGLFSFILDLQLFLLSVGTIVIGLLSFLGFKSLKDVRAHVTKAAADAQLAQTHATTTKTSAEAVESNLQRVRDASARVLHLTDSSERIQRKVIDEFDAIEQGKLAATTGNAPPRLAPEVFERIRRLDQALVTLYHLDLLPDRDGAVRAFGRLARLWASQDRFRRADDRLTLASDLGALAPLVVGQQAVLYLNWGLRAREWSEPKEDPDDLFRKSAEKLEAVSATHKVERVDLLHVRGLLLHHHRREYLKAAKIFRQGLKASVDQKTASSEESLVDTSTDSFRRNLAASLARAGSFSEANEEIEHLPEHEQREIHRDEDFRAMREDKEFGDRLRRLPGKETGPGT
jgi:hypothetical protein